MGFERRRGGQAAAHPPAVEGKEIGGWAQCLPSHYALPLLTCIPAHMPAPSPSALQLAVELRAMPFEATAAALQSAAVNLAQGVA